jgi:pantoate--beta-alanine ligase
MEGKFRPGHFNGVAVVLSKLFHIVSPDVVYFGQKDFQQCAVVKTLIDDLSFNMEMVTVPTVRETSGLAMSSRNRRLSPEGLVRATAIFKGLSLGMQILKETKNETLAKEKIYEITFAAGIEIEYIEIANPKTLLPVDKDLSQMVICFAGFLEGVRLIDNIVVDL